ncbi:ABC transporter permease [Nocardioides sp. zg-DK7169]|uniref:ABC transporter permease n=1 Tax=Nocardioides sp. zg-DK7169 TaxID=2736600 RepID=UPI0015556126|nr:ABC transporter permease [Nocardioides sp. zg-DK7169]NPC97216.1 ABC transporter permease [Nocardioides sp. zg-DK7169]
MSFFAPATPSTAPEPSPARDSLRRLSGLVRANARLVVRNRLTLSYAVVLPVLPLLLVLAGERGEVGPGAAAVITVVMLALLFPVFYNTLSMIVTRRDELVLKRMRTGEVRDAELLVSLAAPGAIIAMLIAVVTVPAAMALGVPAPRAPVLFLLTVLLASVTLATLAFWTAAWTRNAEAAQLTSMPVMGLLVLGQLAVGFPDEVKRWIAFTPGGAVTDLVRGSWFGLGPDDDVPTMGGLDAWAGAAVPLLVLLAWTVLGGWLAARSMRWEPRS